jgi:hypothetical protein
MACRARIGGLVLVALSACGGGGDDGNDATVGETGTMTGNTQGSNSNSATDSADSGSDEAMTTMSGPEECGNGVMEGFEECDDGDANSDSTPNACRVTCHLPKCSDGILDDQYGEECDDGADNKNNEPNACRQDCVLPHCGDNVQDMGESCDDGNPDWDSTCFQCDRDFYFVLNSPDSTGAGDMSIIRADRNGNTVQLVSDAAYNGTVQLALAADNTALYALQASSDRVLAFDGGDGTLLAEIDIGSTALGYDPTPHGIARAGDGKLYVVLDGMGATRVVSVDPGSMAVAEVISLGGPLDVADVASQGSQAAIFVSAGTSVTRVDVAAPGSGNFAGGLSGPNGMFYDEGTDRLWIADHAGGAATIVYVEGGAGVMTFNPVTGYNDPQIHGLAVDVGMVVLATVKTADRVISVQLLGDIGDFFTDMIVQPTDIEIAHLSG